MNELNEKLAELCGITYYVDSERQVWHLHPEMATLTEAGHRTVWTPDKDLNQLALVVNAVESTSDYGAWLTDGLIDLCADPFNPEDTRPCYSDHLWATHPHLVFEVCVQHAQAILRAKGVS